MREESFGELNLWQRMIVLLFLRLPPNIDGFMRRSKHYNGILLQYYTRHKKDIPMGWLTWKQVGIAALETVCFIFVMCCLVFVFLAICAYTDYHWVPLD